MRAPFRAASLMFWLAISIPTILFLFIGAFGGVQDLALELLDIVANRLRKSVEALLSIRHSHQRQRFLAESIETPDAGAS